MNFSQLKLFSEAINFTFILIFKKATFKKNILKSFCFYYPYHLFKNDDQLYLRNIFILPHLFLIILFKFKGHFINMYFSKISIIEIYKGIFNFNNILFIQIYIDDQ
jgi:hypothetical protein